MRKGVTYTPPIFFSSLPKGARRYEEGARLLVQYNSRHQSHALVTVVVLVSPLLNYDEQWKPFSQMYVYLVQSSPQKNSPNY